MQHAQYPYAPDMGANTPEAAGLSDSAAPNADRGDRATLAGGGFTDFGDRAPSGGDRAARGYSTASVRGREEKKAAEKKRRQEEVRRLREAKQRK